MGTSEIIAFYRDGAPGAGRTFEDVMAFDDIGMGAVHDWVQWVFPLPEPSQAQPQSPVLTPEDLALFRTDPALREKVTRACWKWFRFMSENTHWVRPFDHNHLRITRIVRFLSLIQMGWSTTIHDKAVDMMDEAEVLSDRTRRFWLEALASR